MSSGYIATKVKMYFFHLPDQTWLCRCHGSVKTRGVNTRFHFLRYSVAASYKLSHLNLLYLRNYIHSISPKIDVGYWELGSFPGIACPSRISQYATSRPRQVAELVLRHKTLRKILRFGPLFSKN